MKEGIVIHKLANNFCVICDGKTFRPVPRGNLKKDGVFVGDKVLLSDDGLVIEKVLKRKNLLIRPPVANLDKMFIVISPIPKPDLLLVDKLIVFCKVHNIVPCIVVNKNDLDENGLFDLITKDYSNVCDIIKACAKDNDVAKLVNEIDGTCAFAGQSAVGKSSLLNCIFGKNISEIGELSKKIERGKQTTRSTDLFAFNNGYIADTAGFSKLDEELLLVDEKELGSYYDDFMPFAKDCYFKPCAHLNEKVCGIKNALKDKKISNDRYLRYLLLYKSLKEMKK